jgi:hypothetical protein
MFKLKHQLMWSDLGHFEHPFLNDFQIKNGCFDSDSSPGGDGVGGQNEKENDINVQQMNADITGDNTKVNAMRAADIAAGGDGSGRPAGVERPGSELDASAGAPVGGPGSELDASAGATVEDDGFSVFGPASILTTIGKFISGASLTNPLGIAASGFASLVDNLPEGVPTTGGDRSRAFGDDGPSVQQRSAASQGSGTAKVQGGGVLDNKLTGAVSQGGNESTNVRSAARRVSALGNSGTFNRPTLSGGGQSRSTSLG